MEIKDIKKIIQLMKDNELTEFEMEDQGVRIAIKRGNAGEAPVVVASSAPAPMMVAPAAPASVAAPAEAKAAKPADEDEGFVDIKAPIVGTFYRSPAPDVEAFVTVGQEVDEDTVLCIIEAMKVMNEIKAEMHGVVRKILVENATPIEFGQPLFKIEPV